MDYFNKTKELIKKMVKGIKIVKQLIFVTKVEIKMKSKKN